MALNRFSSYIFILLTLAISVRGICKTKLLPLAVKQSITNLRFVSRDGKYTYYQRRSGNLMLSTNYKILTVLKGGLGVHYNIVGTSSRKKLIVTKDDSAHTFLNVNRPSKIFIIPFGSDKAQQIGEGIAPKLHLEDSWISFYNPSDRVIDFKSIKNKSQKFKIKLFNNRNPYFIPEVIMLTFKSVLFTDINGSGVPGVIKYTVGKKETEIIFKGKDGGVSLELCENKDHIYLGSFGLDPSSKGSFIVKAIKQSVETLKTNQKMYKTTKNDLGHIICDTTKKEIFFIKNYSTPEKDRYEVASINNSSLKIKTISDVEFATQFINMDGKLLLPYAGEYYLLQGLNNLKTSDKFKNEKKR